MQNTLLFIKTRLSIQKTRMYFGLADCF